MQINYKNCPLKKRPFFYDRLEDVLDLSLKKRKPNEDIENCLPVKRQCVLNLSTKSEAAMTGRTSTLLHDYSKSYVASPILHKLADATTDFTSDPYRSAFNLAAGEKVMPSLWTYQSNLSAIYPSPATSDISIATTPHSYRNYISGTPPLTPTSDDNCNAKHFANDCEIPMPVLYNLVGESVSASSSSSTSSIYSYSSQFYSAKASNKNIRFTCDKCNKLYSTSMGLSKHKLFHCPEAEGNQDKKVHACQDCGKLYTTVGALKMHIRTHTLPCKCNICGKAFSRPWLLQGHIRTHTGEKPYKCNECPRSFADRSNLRAHQQTHVEVKRYVCKVCKKSFSRMSLLNKHTSSNCVITIV